MSESDRDWFLKEIFSHSMRHPADYEEWRSTLIVFARAVGVEEVEIRHAHALARDEAEGEFEGELSEALDMAEQYVVEYEDGGFDR